MCGCSWKDIRITNLNRYNARLRVNAQLVRRIHEHGDAARNIPRSSFLVRNWFFLAPKLKVAKSNDFAASSLSELIALLRALDRLSWYEQGTQKT